MPRARPAWCLAEASFESDQDRATIPPSTARVCHGPLTVLARRRKEGDLWGQHLCPSPSTAARGLATPRAPLTSRASCRIPAGSGCPSDELDGESKIQKTAPVCFTSSTLNHTPPDTMAALCPLAEHQRSGAPYDSRLSLHREPREGRSRDCVLSRTP